MAKVLVIFATDYGSTKKLAEMVAEGVRSVDGANCVLRPAGETSKEDLISSDAIIFGSPVHMGCLDWRMKKLFDEVCSGLWMKNKLKGKVGAVFASGGGVGNAGAGAELTLLSMLANLAELSMLIVPLPKSTPGYPKGGIHWGVYGRTASESNEPIGLPDGIKEVARNHGANVARVAIAMAGKRVFA